MTHGIEAPHYRLPRETHPGAVVLQVSDLERSIDFYQRMLGFELLGQTPARTELGVASRKLIILESGAAGALRERRLGLYHFAILLPDRAALGRCLAHLLETGIRPGASDHLVSEALYIQDPDGLGIEIYRDRARSEWRTQGDQVAMASEALDLSDVVRAAGGEPWQGMPAETVIGHLHLYVGDLEQAKAFYHTGLGLDLMVWNYPGALFMSAGGYHHHLGTNTWLGPAARMVATDEPRLLEWRLVLPDTGSVAAAAENLVNHGYSVAREGLGDVTATDAWGVTVRLTTAV